MNKFLCLLFVFVFSGCLSSSEDVVWDESEFFEIKTLEDGADVEPVYYFQYPRGAAVSYDSGEGYFDYMSCKVNFGKSTNLSKDENVDVVTRDDDVGKFESWFSDNDLVLYSGFLDKFGYYFWVYDGVNDVTSCISFVDKTLKSFTDSPLYLNEKYSFKVELFSDFKIDYLPSGEGVLMKKWIEEENEKGESVGYKVTIAAYAFENLSKCKDIVEFVADKYPDYNFEFASYGGISGVFVDEALGFDATRHYFAMSDNSEIVYEAYLAVPSAHYSEYKNIFDDFVSTLEIF
jgi:hypothetical protein